MRQDYIRLVKEHILANPEYSYTLNELRATLLSYGVTEEEFDEALRQLTGPKLPQVTPEEERNKKAMDETKQTLEEELRQTKQELAKNILQLKKEFQDEDFPVVTHMTKQRRGMNKWLFIDIASHVVVVVFILMAGVIFSLWFLTTQTSRNQLATTYQAIQKETKGKSFVTQVYANMNVVDAQRIFSFPPSNITLAITGPLQKEVLGFFPYWMLSEQDKVSLNALTSLSLFGIDTDGGGNIITVQSDGTADGGWSMWNDQNLDSFISRARKKKIKLFITMKCFDNTAIEKLVSSDTATQTFISNTLHLVDEKSLNGVNIDFEYSGTPDQKIRTGFTRFISNLSAELKQDVPNGVITVDTYINSAAVPGIFDLQSLDDSVDAFVVMGYDMHSPLGAPGAIAPMEGEISIIGYMQSYLEKLAPEKLILAVPYYGYDWPLSTNSSTPSNAVQTVPYAQVAAESKDAQVFWDDTTQTPWYRYTDAKVTREVHFENTRSLGVKYDYVNRKNLKGIGIWALGYDGLSSDLRELIFEKFAQ